MAGTPGLVDMLAVLTPDRAFDNNRSPEITNSPSVQRPGSADELIEYMDQNGIDQCIIPTSTTHVVS